MENKTNKQSKPRVTAVKQTKSVTEVTIPTKKGAVTVINKNKDVLYDKVIELRAKQGYTKRNLVKFVMQEWQCGNRQARVLVREASELMGEVYNDLYKDSLADSITFMEEMKQQSVDVGDIKMALEIQKELNKVNQLYVIKQEISMRIEQPLFSDYTEIEEIKKIENGDEV